MEKQKTEIETGEEQQKEDKEKAVKEKSETEKSYSKEGQKGKTEKGKAHIQFFEPKRDGMELLSKTKNPLLKRTEAEVLVYHGGMPTPGRHSILEPVSSFLKADPQRVVIDRLYTKSGTAATVAKVLVYDKKEDIPQGKLEKMKPPSKKTAEGKKPEETGEEKKQS